MDQRKKRGSNYTVAEKQILLELIKKFQHIIENKEINANMIMKKREAWYTVCQQYNAVAVSGSRTWKQLRHFYENLKQRVKKNVTNVNQEINHNGGVSYNSTLSEQDSQILAIVTPQIKLSPNPHDEGALYFDDQDITQPGPSKPGTAEVTDDQDTAMATVHQESDKITTTTSKDSGQVKQKLRENTTIKKYFKQKFRNAQLERKYLINKNRMEINKYRLEMQILKLKLNKLKSPR